MGTWEANGHMIQFENFIKTYLQNKGPSVTDLFVITEPMFKIPPRSDSGSAAAAASAPASESDIWLPGWSVMLLCCPAHKRASICVVDS